MVDLNLPVGFYSRWAPDANTPPFSAGLVTVHGGVRTEYQATVTTKLDEIGLDLNWSKIQEILVSTAKEKLGQTSGKGAYNEKESLWGNDDTRRATKAKEEAFKAYQNDKSEEQHCAYKEANKAAKRTVAIAKEEAYEELYTKLDTREGAKITDIQACQK